MRLSGLNALATIVAVALLGGCAAPAPTYHASETFSANSILTKSNPAKGSVVSGPVDKLELWFNPQARLGEVTITGPGGMMPMMVNAVGEVGYYSLPISGLGRGNYKVTWKAAAAGTTYQGSFQFEVR